MENEIKFYRLVLEGFEKKAEQIDGSVISSANINKEDSNIIAIKGDITKKYFRVDFGKVVKVTERIDGVPICGVTEEGEIIMFFGKLIESIKVLRELWFSFKQLFK